MAEQCKCKKTSHRKAPGQAEFVRERNARLRLERHLRRMAKKDSKLHAKWAGADGGPDDEPPRPFPQGSEPKWRGWDRDQRRRKKQIEWAKANGLHFTVPRFVAHCVSVK